MASLRGADIRLYTEATEERITRLDPAVIILAEQGKQVAIAEMAGEIGHGLEMYIRPYYADYLKKNDIKLYTNSVCTKIEDGSVTLMCDENKIARKIYIHAINE